MKILFLIINLLLVQNLIGQNIKTNKKLIIKHGDITLYLTKDTCTQVSKHTLLYSNFLKLDKDRDDNWFEDTYKGKYKKIYYSKSNYDIGHLTPSHITSYDDTINHTSFSLFNSAPQKPSFNRGSWKSLESNVEDSIKKYKKDVTIITGVIYDNLNKNLLQNSKIPIPIYYFKILYIDNKKYVWLGSNLNGVIEIITIKQLNDLFVKYKQNLKID